MINFEFFFYHFSNFETHLKNRDGKDEIKLTELFFIHFEKIDHHVLCAGISF